MKFKIESKVTLRAGTVENLAIYIAHQLGNLFPEGEVMEEAHDLLEVITLALERMRPILEAVRAFDQNYFNHFHSLQYATFLYLVANEKWKVHPSSSIPDRLFLLNKTLNSIDLFYKVKMPEVFFISHGSGCVLGEATYGERFVVFQNVTVGRIGDNRPVIGRNVVAYTGSIITGNTVIGENSVISAGAVLHNIEVPPSVIVYSKGKDISFSAVKKSLIDLYLH